jgi:hypothetical protein
MQGQGRPSDEADAIPDLLRTALQGPGNVGRPGSETPHDPRGPRKLPRVVRTNRPAEVPKASGKAKTHRNPHIGST